MEITVPIKLNVDLTLSEIVRYVKEWVYPLLKEYQLQGADYDGSKAIIKDGKLYWKYYDRIICDTTYEEIKIEDEIIFNMCKGAVEFINSYYDMVKQEQRVSV